MKILIIGASGFVGKHLIDYILNLKDDNIKMYGTYNLGENYREEEVNWIKCSIEHKEEIENIVKELKPSYIVHLASPAYIPDSYKKPRETIDIILQGTLNLLEAIRIQSISSKLLYIGSANEYGSTISSDKVLIESLNAEPDNIYSYSKFTSSLLCQQYANCYGINVIRVRPFNHIGPSQSDRFSCASFGKQIVQIELGMCKDKVIKVGNLDVYRDFLDVRDVVAAYWSLLNLGKSPEVYNVCSGNSVLLRHVLEELISLSECKNQIVVEEDKGLFRSDDKKMVVGSAKKLIELTNWKQNYSLTDTLNDIINFWRRTLNENIK